MFMRMVDPSDEQRGWLRAIVAHTGLAPSALAKKAGVSAPTLTVFLNNPEAKHALSARTVSKIEAATGMRYGPDPRTVSMRQEQDAIPFRPQEGPEEFRLVIEAFGKANGIAPWLLKSRVIESAGYLPGDLLLVDFNRPHQPGDIVYAEIYDWPRSRANSIFRIWEPPSLITATNDASLRKPFVVDNQNITIKGVVIASVRPRQARAA